MQHFRKVLVGIPVPDIDADGQPIPDPPAQAALHQARDLAATTQCSLTLMSVIDRPADGFLTSDEENEALLSRLIEESEAAVKAVAADLTDGLDIDIEERVVVGEPWIEICKAVLADGFQMVLAGTRNAGRLSRFLFGGTGLRLLRNCPCPVWIVKPRGDEESPSNVLIATQLDDVGETALGLAVGGAEMLDARVHVLHVLDLPPARQLGMDANELEAYREVKRDEREAELREHISMTDHRTLEHGVEAHVVSGRPYVRILEAIEQQSVDLLIMGTAARGGLQGALVGNTAEHLLSEVSCSILAIKPPDFVCPVKLDGEEPR